MTKRSRNTDRAFSRDGCLCLSKCLKMNLGQDLNPLPGTVASPETCFLTVGAGFNLSPLLGSEARRVGEAVMKEEGKGVEKEAKITPSPRLFLH